MTGRVRGSLAICTRSSATVTHVGCSDEGHLGFSTSKGTGWLSLGRREDEAVNSCSVTVVSPTYHFRWAVSTLEMMPRVFA